MDPLTLIMVTLLGIPTLVVTAGAIVTLVISRRNRGTRSKAPSTVGTVLLVVGIIGVIVGTAWIVTFFLTFGHAPLSGLGSWNMLIGAVFVVPSSFLSLAGIIVTLVSRAGSRGGTAQGAPTISRG